MSKIHDVARLANVSIATVSRVLNPGDHKVSTETAEKVRRAVKELDYRPNALARALQMKKTMTIGVIIPDISNHYYAEIVRGIQSVAEREGYNIILQNTDRNQDQIVKSIYLLREKIVDGIIFSGGTINGYEPLSALKELRDRVVVIGRHDVDFPGHNGRQYRRCDPGGRAFDRCRTPRNRFYRLVGKFNNCQGPLERIPECSGSEQLRTLSHLLSGRGSLTPESGYEAEPGYCWTEQEPTAIFAGNDQMALRRHFCRHRDGVAGARGSGRYWF